MICGLVGITPAAGYVNGVGAIIIGVVDSAIVWFAWNDLSKVRPFSKVDDALGVVYTHGIAVRRLACRLARRSEDDRLPGHRQEPDVTTSGLFYGHPHQLLSRPGRR